MSQRFPSSYAFVTTTPGLIISIASISLWLTLNKVQIFGSVSIGVPITISHSSDIKLSGASLKIKSQSVIGNVCLLHCLSSRR